MSQPETGESKSPPLSTPIPAVLGRYEIVGVLGRGGMATVYLGRSAGQAGFARLFAIKVLHPHLSEDEGFINMFLEEGQIAARLHHPNVVPIVDIGSQGELRYVVLEYVEGCAFNVLLSRSRDARPPRLIVPIVLDALSGLHAAHTLAYDDGRLMNLVHRDVSPQNVLVGADGASRISDFGVAKAESHIQTTRPGQIKGKLTFMSPEQLKGIEVDRRSDLFSAGCVLWSALTGRRLFLGTNDAATMSNILWMEIPRPSTVGLKPPAVFDAICMRALDRDRDKRWSSAAEMEDALRETAQKHGMLGSRREVSEWVTDAFDAELKARRAAILEVASRTRPNAMDTGEWQRAVSSGLRMIPAVGASEGDVDPSSPHSEPDTGAVTLAAPSSPSGAVAQASVSRPVQTRASALDAPVTPPRRVAYLVAAATVVAGLGVWLLMRPPAPLATDSNPIAKPAPVAAAATPPATPPPASPSPAPADPASSAPAATVPALTRPAEETTPKDKKATAPSLGKKPRAPSNAAEPATVRAPAANCDPPFVVDSNGIERFKPNCL